jgi:endonuclease/exonuclease/phosphatase (EEP) superfamily protein YafD
MPTPLESIIDRIDLFFTDRRNPEGSFQRALRCFRLTVFGANLLYLLSLVSLLVAISVVGERFWLLALLLYIPVHLWLTPLLVLTPVTILVCPRQLILHLCACLWVCFHGGLVYSPEGGGGDRTVTVVTSNQGNRNGVRLSPFLAEIEPDFLVFQEARHRRRAFARTYPDWHVEGTGEFVIVSRFPLKSTRIIRIPLENGSTFPVAARFEAKIADGTTVAVYAVHVPTPRSDLERLIGLGLFAAEGRRAFKESVAERIHLVEGLLNILQEERLPYLLAGDFNIPARGYLYSMIADRAQDVFFDKGLGFGYTFPGDSRNPAVFFKPWLRLDYVFASEAWEPLSCRVEPGSRAQHRAVAATVVLRE